MVGQGFTGDNLNGCWKCTGCGAQVPFGIEHICNSHTVYPYMPYTSYTSSQDDVQFLLKRLYEKIEALETKVDRLLELNKLSKFIADLEKLIKE